MFGPHLVLEGYGGNPQKLSDVGLMYQALDTMPARIGMTKIMPPHIQKYLDPSDSEWGISGFVIIAESHIAIHTFPAHSFLTLDIFSCKPFDIERAIALTVEEFELSRYEHRVFSRGRDYPRDIERSARLVETDREKLLAAVK